MAIRLSGLDEIGAKLAAAIDNTPERTKQGVWEIAMDIGADAALRAPLDLGHLRGSMNVEVKDEGEEVVARIKFSETYAAYQHEHVELNHPKGGEAKYLEKAAREKYDQISAKVAEALSSLFEGV